MVLHDSIGVAVIRAETMRAPSQARYATGPSFPPLFHYARRGVTAPMRSSKCAEEDRRIMLSVAPHRVTSSGFSNPELAYIVP